MTDDNEFINPGAYVFKPGKVDDGKIRYSNFGKPINLEDIPSNSDNPSLEEDEKPPELSLSGLFTGQQKWLNKNQDMVKALHTALESLPVSERQAIDLLFFQKLSFKEAGRVMQIGKSSVQSYYERAVKSLQQYFQNDAVRMDKGMEEPND